MARQPDADLADFLRALKERSGLSYGALANRLHVSTSTLHRYCSGAAVPAGYATVEQFVRLCQGTPEERDEAYRRWVVADALRSRGPADRAAAETVAPETPAPQTPAPETTAVPAEPSPDVTPPGELRPPRRARRAVLVGAGLGALAVAGGIGFAFAWPLAHRTPDGRTGLTAVSATSSTPAATSAAELPGAGATTTSTSSTTTTTTTTTTTAAPAPPPLTVVTQPYHWPDPCSPAYLVDRPPAEVPPRPDEQDAPAWVRSLGAISATSQDVEITVQGTGARTVVLRDLHVRVVSSGPPPRWNMYTMGDGCGGGVGSGYFELDLDRRHPTLTGREGQHLLPLKVSEGDPEVLEVSARTEQHDVRWYLELDWSSGSRQGTLRIDDHGRPFRTAAGDDRRLYWPADAPATGWQH